MASTRQRQASEAQRTQGPTRRQAEGALRLRLDHLIFGVRDLEAASERFLNQHGLASVPGGRHRGWGTANAIVPLGNEYVELVAVVDENEAGGTPFGEWVARGTAAGDRPLGWAVATDDIDAVAERLGVAVIEGGRIRPDGTALSWRLAGFERMLEESAFPIFIEWSVPEGEHPARMRVEHRVAPRRLAWISVSGAEAELRRWLGPGHELPVRIEPGDAAIAAAAVETSEGEVVLS